MGCKLAAVQPAARPQMPPDPLQLHKCLQKDDEDISPLQPKHLLQDPLDSSKARLDLYEISEMKETDSPARRRVMLKACTLELGEEGSGESGSQDGPLEERPAGDRRGLAQAGPLERGRQGRLAADLMGDMSPPSITSDLFRKEAGLGPSPELLVYQQHGLTRADPDAHHFEPADRISFSGIDESSIMKKPADQQPFEPHEAVYGEKLANALKKRREAGDKFFATVAQVYQDHLESKKNELSPTHKPGAKAKSDLLSKLTRLERINSHL